MPAESHLNLAFSNTEVTYYPGEGGTCIHCIESKKQNTCNKRLLLLSLFTLVVHGWVVFLWLLEIFILFLYFAFRKNVPRMLLSAPHTLCRLFLINTHLLTANLVLPAASPECVSWPFSLPCFPGCLFMLHLEPLARLKTGLGE